jgi:hypothetical protein
VGAISGLLYCPPSGCRRLCSGFGSGCGGRSHLIIGLRHCARKSKPYGSSLVPSRGERSRSIGCTVSHDRIVLQYRYQGHVGAWESATETVWLDWTPCHYEGQRPWFRCPGYTRRVGILCDYGKWFRCRHCHRLPYASQQQSYADRMAAQARQGWKRLGASMSLFEPVWPWQKPKGMHWRPFARLTAREQRYYQASLLALRAWLDKREPARK